MSVTMTDVARAANVSVATVGRVLHSNGYVSPEARKRVEEAVAALGYVPNQMARTLKSRRSGIIGHFVIPNPNGLYHSINQSIMDAAQKNGFQLLTIESQPGCSSDEELINTFIGLHADGLIITSNPHLPPEIFSRLQAAGIPVVAVERGYAEYGVDSLVVRDFEGVYHAVKRIAEHGHKRVGLIAMRPFHAVEQQRWRGYLAAVQDFQLSEQDGLVQIVESYAPQFGETAMEKLLALPEPPTAVFTTADTLAAGAMQTLYRHHIRVPDQMSIVGYDNILSQSLSPQIDSVGLVQESIGDTAVELLIKRMEDPHRQPEIRLINTVYVDRNTVRQL